MSTESGNPIIKTRIRFYQLEVQVTTRTNGQRNLRKAVAKPSIAKQYHSNPVAEPKMIVPGSLVIEATGITFVPETDHA